MERMITNFVKFEAKENGSRTTIVKNEAGEELGFEVSGMLTKFDYKNENDGNFKKGSYDKFVEEYYEKNGFNVPLCLQHDDTDVRNLCGYVKTMTKTDDGIHVVAFIPRYAYYYNLIRQMVDGGILQGFSNCGIVYIEDYTEEDGEIITEFKLLHVALVTTPADVNGKFEKVKNTLFNGFNEGKKKEEEVKNDIDPEIEIWM